MSHAFLVALVPQGTPIPSIEEWIAQRMAPYDEAIEVAPYDEDCGCRGLQAREVARAAAEMVKSMDAYRKEFHQRTDLAEEWSEERDEQFRQFIAPYRELARMHEMKHPRFEQPDSACKTCGGTGRHSVTYNPRSKWDWYRVGGRWDGAVRGAVRESVDGGFNVGRQHEEQRHNLTTAAAYAAAIRAGAQRPFAMLLPDGAWHERGHMGMFAIVSEEKPRATWDEMVDQILAAHADCFAVGIDYHI